MEPYKFTITNPPIIHQPLPECSLSKEVLQYLLGRQTSVNYQIGYAARTNLFRPQLIMYGITKIAEP